MFEKKISCNKPTDCSYKNKQRNIDHYDCG